MTQGGDQGQPGQDYGQYGQGFPPAPPAPSGGDPYGQPAYGQPPYGPDAYGQVPWAPPGYGGVPTVRYASWGQRAVALLLDGLFSLLLFIPGIAVVIVGAVQADNGASSIGGTLLVLGGLLCFAAFGVQVWNQGWRQGAQGWSWGKQIVKIKLVRTVDAQPPGGGTGIGRLLLRNVLGNASFGIYTLLTFLWPLWDDQSQTLDDKILNTWVIDVS